MPERHVEQIKQIIGGISKTLLIVGATSFGTGIDQVRSVYAGDPTLVSSAAPTPTATPDAAAIRKQIASKTSVALSTEEEAARIEAANKVARERIDAILTPAPKTNEIVTAVETVVQGRLNEKATATARAMPSMTPTPRPTLVPPPTAVSGNKSTEGGINFDREILKGEFVVGVAAVLLIALFIRMGAERRDQLLSLIEDGWVATAREARRIRNRIGRTPPPGGTGTS